MTKYILQKPRNYKGFTLSELVVVIGIIGIVSALVIPYGLSALRREDLRASSVEVAGFIQNVRRNAMARSTQCTVDIAENGIITASEIGAANGTNRCFDPSLYPNGILDLRARSDDQTLRAQRSPDITDLTFSMNGTSLFAADQEIELTLQSVPGYTYCILVTSPLGFVKTGSKSTGISNCQYTRAL